MCSISDDITDEVLSEKQSCVEKKCDPICRKCAIEKAAVVLQRKFSYCKTCFLQLVTHKFRASIGKLKLRQMKDRILLVFSGSASSTALLHLLWSGMNENNHKKLTFNVEILVIDDSVLWPKTFDPASTLLGILDILEQFPFKRYIVKLSTIYSRPMVNEFEAFEPPDQYDVQLQRLFAGVKSSTSKMDLLYQLRSRMSYECAALLNCNKIFISDCATDVAIRLLSDTTLGRCSEITYDTAICDTRNQLIHRIKPLRELVSKEITFYNVFNNLESLVLPSATAMFDYNPSLQYENLLFISNLQEEFPSTVYTVFNIGDKLQNTENTAKSVCSLCGIPFSTMLEIESISNSNTELLASRSSFLDDEKAEKKFKPQLCYGCQRIIDDTNTSDNFPLIMVNQANYS